MAETDVPIGMDWVGISTFFRLVVCLFVRDQSRCTVALLRTLRHYHKKVANTFRTIRFFSRTCNSSTRKTKLLFASYVHFCVALTIQANYPYNHRVGTVRRTRNLKNGNTYKRNNC